MENLNGDRRSSGDGLRTPDSGASQANNSSTTTFQVDEQVLPTSVVFQPQEAQLFPDATTWPAPDFNANDFDFPSFFEHIMDPDPTFGLTDAIQVPPELSTLMPTRDWYSDSDIFGLEFTPTLDQAIGTINYPFPVPEVQQPTEIPKDASDVAQGADKRHKIYQQSPWYLITPISCRQTESLTTLQAVETRCEVERLQRGQ